MLDISYFVFFVIVQLVSSMVSYKSWKLENVAI
jgi:hypothetical protein